MTTNENTMTLIDWADAVSAELDADIIMVNGPIEGLSEQRLLNLCERPIRRSNVLLVLTTLGGSADSAYRMARAIKRTYKHFTIYIMSRCKSSGTLVAVGANQVAISDRGELGPLDVQLTKPGEFGEWSSGLTAMQALNTLQTQARNLFADWFVWFRINSGYQITSKMASEIASNAAVGLYSAIYAQIDPMRLGEIDREIRIAVDYGNRIGTDNLKPDALTRLVGGYPSHSFVIDREEATQLFQNVRPPRRLGHGSSGIQPVVVLPTLKPQPVVGQSTRDPGS